MTDAERQELDMLEWRAVADLPFTIEDMLRRAELRQKQSDEDLA